MAVLQTKHLFIRPIQGSDIQLLYKWRNSLRFLNFCSVRRNFVSLEEFENELRYDFEHDRHIQLMIERKCNQQILGTIYSYNLNLVDGYVFITIFIDEEYENKGYGAEAMALFMAYLFESFPLRKIYTEVYDYNTKSWASLERAGFILEGTFKEHRYFNGQYWDMRRYAIFKDRAKKIQDFLSRLNNRAGNL